jgi:hypothetical protein
MTSIIRDFLIRGFGAGVKCTNANLIPISEM